jgi:hypothetical protein
MVLQFVHRKVHKMVLQILQQLAQMMVLQMVHFMVLVLFHNLIPILVLLKVILLLILQLVHKEFLLEKSQEHLMVLNIIDQLLGLIGSQYLHHYRNLMMALNFNLLELIIHLGLKMEQLLRYPLHLLHLHLVQLMVHMTPLMKFLQVLLH